MPLRRVTGDAAAATSATASVSDGILLPELARCTLELALTIGVLAQFRVVSHATIRLLFLALGGFVVHALLPRAHRLTFFVALSIAGIWLTLGVTATGLVLGGVALFTGACYLPGRTAYKVVLVVLLGAVLAAVNDGWAGLGKSYPAVRAALPTLGSMLMFRIFIALYDLSHADRARQPTVKQTAAYFLLLPNVCFPLFPVVDLQTAIRTYYNDRDARIYSAGTRWMLIGGIHLIGYHLVTTYLAIDPFHVETARDRLQYLFYPYLCYLQVSGQFHICVGVLHLFGFNLPRTHNDFYLARSFTDLWRRINIYWTAFMQKMVFYPVSFALRRRKWSETAIMVAGTSAVALATWILHPYQTFWLRRVFPLEAKDAIFWGSIGILLIATSLVEQKRGRARSLKPAQERRLAPLLRRGLGTVATFTTMSVLWSIWSAPSVTDWLRVLQGR